VPFFHAAIGCAAWAALLGAVSVWQRFCQTHPEVARRLEPPEPSWIGDEAEEWLRGQG